MKKLFLILVALGFAYNIAYAYDFSAVASSGQTLYYNIKSPTTVECVGPGGENMGTWSGYTKPAGTLTIPSSVTHAGISYTVKSIAMYAFSQCTTLTSITIPSSVNRIGSWAFWNDTAMHTINLPTTGVLMGQAVIQGTGWYQDQPDGLVYLGNTLIGYKGTIPTNYSLAVPSNIISIAGSAFFQNWNNNDVVSISLPSTLKYIGDYAFYNCNITAITLPSSLKGIGANAFYGNLITSITIPSTVEYIGSSSFGQCGSLTTVHYNAINANENDMVSLSPFYNCSAFTSLHIGTTVQRIPAYLFSNCTSIQGTLSLPNSLLSVGNYSFQGCTGISGSLQIKNSVQTIGQMAFYGCTGITSLTIGTAVDSIASSAFGGMTNLTTINFNAINCSYVQNTFTGTNVSHFNIGSSVQTIPDNLIYQCSNLTSVTFPNALTRIGSMNFSMCGLTGALNLPANLTQIGYGAFNMCTGITSIQCAATTPPTIETQYGVTNTFNNGTGYWNTPLLVPCSSISAYQSAIGWNNFTNISGIGGCNYTVTLSVNNSSMGSVSGGGTYTQGATATISATANSGYHFDHWSDGNTQNPRSLTVTNDISLTAYFEANPVTQYTITVNSNNATMGSASGGGTFNEGTTTTITATANSGYHFTQWQDGNTSNPRTITVTSNATYTAYFAPTQYTITVNSHNATMGSASGGGTFNEGTTTTITATANSGYHFTQWQDGNTSNPRTITVAGNATYTAYFAPTQYTITVNSNNPTMGSASGGGTFNEGTTTTITATANSGYHFTQWQDGNTTNPRTITVTGNATYTAYFEATPPTQYTITVSSANATMGSVAGGGTFNAGTSISIAAVANSGYHFSHWQDGNTSNPRTITVTGNATYIAYFEDDAPMQYTIIVTSDNTAMGTVSGGGTYNEGTTISISAIANEGYRFEHWQDNNTQNPRTITVTSNATYTAYFVATQGIDDVIADAVNVYTLGGQIVVETELKEEIVIYDIVGRKVDCGHKTRFDVPASGVYLVKIGTMPTQKVVVVK